MEGPRERHERWAREIGEDLLDLLLCLAMLEKLYGMPADLDPRIQAMLRGLRISKKPRPDGPPPV